MYPDRAVSGAPPVQPGQCWECLAYGDHAYCHPYTYRILINWEERSFCAGCLSNYLIWLGKNARSRGTDRMEEEEEDEERDKKGDVKDGREADEAPTKVRFRGCWGLGFGNLGGSGLCV